jgi:hypothetical protein
MANACPCRGLFVAGPLWVRPTVLKRSARSISKSKVKARAAAARQVETAMSEGGKAALWVDEDVVAASEVRRGSARSGDSSGSHWLPGRNGVQFER